MFFSLCQEQKRKEFVYMKKICAVFILLCLISCFCSCGSALDTDGDSNIPLHSSAAYEDDNNDLNDIIGNEDNGNNKFIFAWLSYLELRVTKQSDTPESYKAYITNLFSNMKKLSVTDVFLHVKPFEEVFYSSNLFTVSPMVKGKNGENFDVLSVVIDIAKNFGIGVHAWINPYRISTMGDISSLPDSSVAKSWYSESANDVIPLQNGIYLNPASMKAQKLILDTVRELLTKYDIKGIHIDDYFYPENCGNFDSTEYLTYKNGGGSLSLEDFRREQVNTLIKAIYSLVKSFGEDKIFSISPCGDIDKAYNELFCDIYSWCSKEGFCDIIIPQIYFGFQNETLPFEKCLDSWCQISDQSKTKLAVGLALYKAGQADAFAGRGKNEWVENDDVLKRQIECLYEKDCYGFSLYSASYINFSETIFENELNNIKNVLQ